MPGSTVLCSAVQTAEQMLFNGVGDWSAAQWLCYSVISITISRLQQPQPPSTPLSVMRPARSVGSWGSSSGRELPIHTTTLLTSRQRHITSLFNNQHLKFTDITQHSLYQTWKGWKFKSQWLLSFIDGHYHFNESILEMFLFRKLISQHFLVTFVYFTLLLAGKSICVSKLISRSDI